ncbi:ketoreductase [Neofusicoccum parvum]|uniref:Ketoreductase n=1 Tax=Neofusicoccum parvum TaxID=310453 RepID=A0ACB5SNV3_9PEZI|nr:ketoreductase [Neofusicoccum parvum]GME66428.1 ketoreductase [Neofusicoccum parvum]
MTRVLLTGGSGFIAAHVLDVLLQRGHSVVTTVRSQEKADRIKAAHPNHGKDKLDFAIVPDIAQEGAFDAAVQSSPPIEAVIHTASPLNLNITDVQKEVLDPAIVGTVGLLKSAHAFAPTVTRVVVLSSFAAMIDLSLGDRPAHTYSAADWNPISHAEALADAVAGYRGSKTFAERAAWEYVERERPGFALTTLCPPFVFGPVVHYLSSLDALNNSNRRFLAFLAGQMLPTTFYAWVDVRDVALGHVKAMEDPRAAGERIFFTSDEQFCNKDILEIISREFPEYRARLPPTEQWDSVGYPGGGVYKLNSTRAREILGGDFTPLEKCVVDTIGVLQTFDV